MKWTLDKWRVKKQTGLLSDSRNCRVAYTQDADVNGRQSLVQLNNSRMPKKDCMQ
jgi:hypothetical protein